MKRWLQTAVILALALPAAMRANAEDSATKEKISRHVFKPSESGHETAYLIYEPAGSTPKSERSLLIYLHGAGGSIDGYNLARKPYAELRASLAKRGYYILVPDLGPRHFMNAPAKQTLDALVDRVLVDYQIDAGRVHMMGTSMGAGSALAYAIHRPEMVRSVCAVMPMTDFSEWVSQNPKYASVLKVAYGGTPQEKPQAYDDNSAMKNLDAFAEIPVLLIHGNADRIVPYEHSVKLAAALKAKGYPCVLRTADGGGHADAIMTDFQLEAADFFDAATP